MPKTPEKPIDDKAHIRHQLDLTNAQWRRTGSENKDYSDAAEYAYVPHTDGVTYVAIRQSADPGGLVLIFTPTEWEAFALGDEVGDFDFAYKDSHPR